MSVPFVQFILPDARKKHIWVDVPSHIEEKAYKIIENGWRFEAEILRTGEVSLTVTSEEADEAIEICENKAEEVCKAVNRLVESAFNKIN